MSDPTRKHRVLKLFVGSRALLFRRGNYSCRRLIPFIEHGPFRTFTASWEWGQIEWSLKRWS